MKQIQLSPAVCALAVRLNLRKAGKVFLALVSFLLLVSVALAQSGGGSGGEAPNADYDISWRTVDGGGGTIGESGGGHTLMGTVGQPEPGPALTGGDYTLVGGFWPAAGVGADEHTIYLPLILRNFS